MPLRLKQVALVAANFGAGALATWWMSNALGGAIRCSLVLMPLWLGWAVWYERKTGHSYVPILFFPNPLLAMTVVLVLALLTGGGAA